jgi:hemerythrin-like domain-containing protein
MQATTILRQEHDAILKMLDGLDDTSHQLGSGISVPPATLNGLLEFFQLFADRCHHGKEEELLFPLLERKGMPRGGGPLGVMLFEHDHGRQLVREMVAAATEYQGRSGPAGERWAKAAQQYSTLLREHILKENNILFSMAERMLTPEEQDSLGAEFEKSEVEKMGAGTHERLHARMEQLLSEIAQTGVVTP